MKRTFNVALVGCGVISYNHLTALKALDNVRVTALCDIKEERALAVRDEFKLDSKIYTDYDLMLKSEMLDAVHICTPHYLHAPMTVAALERNIYVCLEKPMCTSREQITAMLETEAKSDAKVTVSFQNRFNKSYMMARKIAAEDGVKSAYVGHFWKRTDNYYTDSDWRGRYATEGGGVMINQAIHSIDFMISVLGKPASLRATKANHFHKEVIEVEDTCEGIVEFEGGKYGNFYATNNYQGSCQTTIFIETEKRGLEIRNAKLYINGTPIEESAADGYLGKQVYGDGHMTLISEFYSAIETGAEMPITLESAQWALRLLLAAYDSNGETVPV